MIAAVLGAVKMPPPRPLRNTRIANTQYSKFTGINSNAMKETAISNIPPTVNGRAPKRSEREPAIGAATRKPMVIGSR